MNDDDARLLGTDFSAPSLEQSDSAKTSTSFAFINPGNYEDTYFEKFNKDPFDDRPCTFLRAILVAPPVENT